MTSEDEEVAIEEKKDYGNGGVWGDHWGVDEPTDESEKIVGRKPEDDFVGAEIDGCASLYIKGIMNN